MSQAEKLLKIETMLLKIREKNYANTGISAIMCTSNENATIEDMENAATGIKLNCQQLTADLFNLENAIQDVFEE